jgi:ketosteroid isomerase-like protein
MRKVVLGAGLVGALTLGTAAARAQDTPQRADVVWTKAMKANDLDAIVACYAPDAVMWMPDAPEARGREAIRGVYASYLDAYTVTDAALTDASYETSGDLTGSWGHFSLSLQPKKGGDPVALKGRYVVVMKRIGGNWLLAADHASANPPPKP